MQKWHTLLQEIEVINTIGDRAIVTEAELVQFERSTNIVLPNGYKEYRSKIFINSVKKQIKTYPAKKIRRMRN